MPHSLFIHLCGCDLNALVGDVIDAVTKALFAELFFDVDAGGLQVKRFARGAGERFQLIVPICGSGVRLSVVSHQWVYQTPDIVAPGKAGA